MDKKRKSRSLTEAIHLDDDDRKTRSRTKKHLDADLLEWTKRVGTFTNEELGEEAIRLRDVIIDKHDASVKSGDGRLLTKEDEKLLRKDPSKDEFTKGWASRWRARYAVQLHPMREGSKQILEWYAAHSLKDLLSEKVNPSTWSVWNERIDRPEGEILAGLLARPGCKCTKLALSTNSMAACTFEAIGNSLTQMIQKLSIYQISAIREEGVGIRLISQLTHLKIVQLWDCGLDDDDATILANLLKGDKVSIEELILTNNKIGRRGAAEIAEHLRKNTKLKVLSLDGNEIGRSETSPFKNMLRENITLERLHLHNTGVGNELCAAFESATNSNISDLMLGQNEITDPGAISLSVFLRRDNSNVSFLKLSGNMIGPDGIKAIIDAIGERAQIIQKRAQLLQESPEEELGLVDVDALLQSDYKNPMKLAMSPMTKESNRLVEAAVSKKLLERGEFPTHDRPDEYSF